MRTEPSTALRPPRWISFARCWKRRGLYPDAFGLTGCIWYNRRSILLHRPQSNFEFDGVVLSWFRSAWQADNELLSFVASGRHLRLLSVVYPRVLCWGLFCSFCTWCHSIRFSPTHYSWRHTTPPVMYTWPCSEYYSRNGGMCKWGQIVDEREQAAIYWWKNGGNARYF